MPHPFLDVSPRLAGGGHCGAEGVAQLVEGDAVNLRALKRVLEALDEL